ncbi:MAG TPA: MoaD/ThiS family protein [Feifaniaceae bacterium]|nr:MoaD/ThiS family protein [Feifaniaceae bacterium]
MKTIRYYAPLRAMLQKESEETGAKTVREVLDFIKVQYGKEARKAAESALIVVNDVSIGLFDGKKTVLKDGDVIGFLPLCGGG